MAAKLKTKQNLLLEQKDVYTEEDLRKEGRSV
jgi:hypothetical protein